MVAIILPRAVPWFRDLSLPPCTPEPRLPNRLPILGEPAARGDRRILGRRVEGAPLDRVEDLPARRQGLCRDPLPGIADQVQGADARPPEREGANRLETVGCRRRVGAPGLPRLAPGVSGPARAPGGRLPLRFRGEPCRGVAPLTKGLRLRPEDAGDRPGRGRLLRPWRCGMCGGEERRGYADRDLRRVG